jgi:hypothetical protein
MKSIAQNEELVEATKFDNFLKISSTKASPERSLSAPNKSNQKSEVHIRRTNPLNCTSRLPKTNFEYCFSYY